MRTFILYRAVCSEVLLMILETHYVRIEQPVQKLLQKRLSNFKYGNSTRLSASKSILISQYLSNKEDEDKTQFERKYRHQK